ncbi:hypothetical protein L0Y40_01140 [Candidatus Wolfebacteria bacterium]|nr:hypothetical protein [Candidatus Wolfebacteria bacterium]
MKKYIFTALAVALGLPLLSYGATYTYVATTGDVKTVEAQTAEEAMVQASDRAPNSGVALDSGAALATEAQVFGVGGIGGNIAPSTTIDVDGDGTLRYQYITVTGNVDSVEAVNAEQALALPVDLALHSGVVRAETNPIPESAVVPL